MSFNVRLSGNSGQQVNLTDDNSIYNVSTPSVGSSFGGEILESATAPATRANGGELKTGDIWFNTTDSTFSYYVEGTGWDVSTATTTTPLSTFPNDAGYITSADIPADTVTSVNGQTGDVVLTFPEVSVTSVNGETGVVVLDAADVGAATVAQGTLADSALQPSAIGTTVQPFNADVVIDANYVRTDNNFTTAEKNKLASIDSDAEANVQSDWNATSGAAEILNKPTLGTASAADSTDFATAAQGTLADTSLQPDAIGTTVQPYDPLYVRTEENFTSAASTKLDGIEPGAEVNVQSDWNATTGPSSILNKPTLGTAAGADSTDFATAAQGTLADSAVQPSAIGTTIQPYDPLYVRTEENFTSAASTKLDGIEPGAEVNVNADWNAATGDAAILNKPVLGTAAGTDSSAYATAAQGLLADSSLQNADLGVTVQGYDADTVVDANYVRTDENFTTAEKTKLAGVQAGAQVNPTNVSELTNDAGYITSVDIPQDAVLSVNGQAGIVVLDAEDVGALASGDNISELVNDAGYITSAQVPQDAVLSVNGQAGIVVLDAADVGAATTAQGATADSALQPTDIGVTVQAFNSDIVIDANYVRTDNNFTTAEKGKLATIEEGAEVNVQSDWTAISGDALILNKPTFGTAAFTDSSAYATAAQGTTADSALQPSAVGVTVQAFDSNIVIDPLYVRTDENFTTAEKSKLAGIGPSAEANVQSDWNATTGPSSILNKPTLGTAAATDSTAYATSAQGTLADSAVQPSAIGTSIQPYNANTVVDSFYVRTDENFTTAEKNKLNTIEPGAEVNVQADWNSIGGDSLILNKPTLGTAASADSADFATAAQGTTADSALQPDVIGVTVQPYDANTVVDSLYVRTQQSFTSAEKTKLAGVADGAEVNVNADWNAITGDAQILNKPTLGTAAAADSGDFATAAEGDLAATSLQPGDLGVTVQGYDADTVVDPLYVRTQESYTTAEKSKLAGIAAGAEVNVQSDWNATTGDAFIANKPALGSAALSDSSDFATAAQGTTADSALQPTDLGVTVQGYDANTVVDANYVHTDNNFTTAQQTKLSGIEVGAEVNVNADWNAISGDAFIANKPALGSAALQDSSAFATAAQGTTADSALQPADISVTVQPYSAATVVDSNYVRTDNNFTDASNIKLNGIETGAQVNPTVVSAFTNDAGYLTNADLPPSSVVSVNGETGVVSLDAADVGAATSAQGLLADSSLQPADVGITVQGYNAGTVIDPSYVHTDNNFTTTEKSKLASINANAEANVNADWTATAGDALILNKPVLGTAAAADTTDFATAAQGLLSDSSLQPADVGVTVQGYDANTVVDPNYVRTDNNFTTAQQTKLAGIETNATADQTGAEIKALYEAEADTNAFTDASQSKLAGIEAGAQANVDTDLSYNAGTRQLTSSTGTDVTLPLAVGNASDGLLSASDKAQLDSLSGDLAGKADLVGGKLDQSQLPDIAVTEYLGEAANEAAMLLLVGQEGDWANRTDDGKVYVITGSDPSIATNWTALNYPVAAGTDLSYTSSSRVLSSSTGTDTTLPLVVASGDAGLLSGADKAKLDGIETGATADQTDAEIKVAYESNNNTNAYTDAEQTKLAGIAAGAEVNVNADWNAATGDAAILNKPTLGTAAATDSTAYATAAQGGLADSSLQPGDLGVTVQAYSPATVVDAFYVRTDNNFTNADSAKLDGIQAGANLVTDNSQLLNGAGYLTAGDIPDSAVLSINGQTGEVVLTAADVGAATTAQGALADSALQSSDIGVSVQAYDTNTVVDAFYVRTDQNFTNADHAKLDGIAAGAEVNVNADWNAVSGDAFIENKPALGTAAFTSSATYATAAQGALADTSLQPSDISVTVQSYNVNTVVDALYVRTDNNFTNTEQAKLAGIETGATADQTAGEIKVAYESNANTNAFTDAEQTKLSSITAGAQPNVATNLSYTQTTNLISSSTGTDVALPVAGPNPNQDGLMSWEDKTKLDGVETNATADQTDAEIKTAYENNADTNAFTDANVAKLAGIEPNATADQTAAEIKALYEGEPDTNAFTDADEAKLDGIAAGAEVNVDTNLSYDQSINELASSTGTNVTLPVAGPLANEDGLMSHEDKAKLDGIETGATGDQTGAEIKALYEAEANTNAFTDGDRFKMDGIESGATADQTGAEIKALYEAEADTNAFTDAEQTKLASINAGAQPNVATDLSYTQSTNELASSTGTNVTLPVAGALTDQDGLMSFEDKSKLDGIELGATADQTAGEIKVAYESNVNTNAYTDSERNKLAGIEAGATGDMNSSEIKISYESNPNTNAFTDTHVSKLAGIEDNATADQTDAEIKLAYESNSDTNAFTDAHVTKLDGIETGATADQTDAEIKTAYENNIDTNAFTDAEQTKLAGIAAGAEVNVGTNLTYNQSSNLLSSSTGSNVALPVAGADANQDGLMSHEDKAFVDGLPTTLAAKADLVDGKLSASQVPDIAITEYLGEVANETAMLALTGQEGDWCSRTDDGKVYIITGADPSLSANWTALSYPAASVTETNLGYTQSTRLLTSSTGADVTLPLAGALTNEDGLMSHEDKAKLDGIETGATGDQSDAEIKVAYENNANTNAFTDADVTKLAGIETNATADQTDAEIKTAYENNLDTNAFTDAEQTKLTGIESSAQVNVQSDWNAVSGDSFIQNKPTLGTAAATDATAYATSSQGALADTALQPTDSIGDLSDVDITTVAPTSGQVLQWDGSNFTPATVSGGEGGGTTNLSYTASPTDGTVASDTGTDATIILANGTNAGLMAPGDFTKLGGIETNATADQTDAEIKTAYENNLDTNAFTDAEQTKLSGIAAGAEVNVDTNLSYTQSTNELASSTGTNVTLPLAGALTNEDGLMSHEDKAKLDGIETGATADQTDAEIKTAYENNADTNAFTDAEQTKLAGIAAGATAVTTLNTLTDVDTTGAGTGQFLQYNGTNWVSGSASAAPVDSVNGEVGVVVLDSDDIGEGSVNLYSQWVGATGGINYTGGNIGIGDTAPGEALSVTGNIALTGTVDGRDVAADGTKLDGIATGAEVNVDTNLSYTQSTNELASSTGTNVTLPLAGALTDEDGLMSHEDKAKLDGIAAGAEVNVDTNLSYTQSTNELASSTGTNVTLPLAGTTADTDGLMSHEDKSKLDGIASGAQVNTITSVNSQTGVVVLDPDDLDDAFTTHKFATAAQLAKADNAASASGSIGQFFDCDVVSPSEDQFLRFNATNNAFVNETVTIPTNNNQLTNGAGYITSADGGNAATLDTLDSTQFLRSDAGDVKTSGTLRFNDSVLLTFGTGGDAELFCDGSHMYMDLNSGIGNFYIRDGTTTRFTFNDNGDFTATGNVTAYSDINLKENIEVIPDALNKVSQLRGVTYDRKDMDGERQAGVIAQEVEAVLPEVVHTHEDGIKSVAYGNLVGLLIESIKELKAEVEELKKDRN